MGVLRGLLMPFQLWNDVVLKIGRWAAIIAMTLMVIAILVQVFYRYVLSNPLPWPEEAARFMMLWMTGLIAPMGYRRGGFVAIDMVVMALPERIGALISLFLLTVAGVVLAIAVQIGWGEVTGFGGRFATSSLYYPTGDGWAKVPKAWMMSSLFVGTALLLIVNIELIIRALIALVGGGDQLRPIPPGEDEIMAE